MDPFFWSMILIAAGMCVVVLELFLPSAGILGVVAAGLMLSGIVCAFFVNLQTGAIVLLCTALLLPLLLVTMIKVWPSTPIGRRILLDDFSASDVLPQNVYSKDMVGQLGVAKTKMLPSGIVIINDVKLDAVSDGFAIDAGQTIKVVSVKGNHIHVQPFDGDVSESDNLTARDGDILSQPIEDFGIDALDEPLS